VQAHGAGREDDVRHGKGAGPDQVTLADRRVTTLFRVLENQESYENHVVG